MCRQSLLNEPEARCLLTIHSPQNWLHFRNALNVLMNNYYHPIDVAIYNDDNNNSGAMDEVMDDEVMDDEAMDNEAMDEEAMDEVMDEEAMDVDYSDMPALIAIDD
jgi:hypothetical protein